MPESPENVYFELTAAFMRAAAEGRGRLAVVVALASPAVSRAGEKKSAADD